MKGDKFLYKRAECHFDIKKLCFNHLGLIADDNLAQLKRKLGESDKPSIKDGDNN